MTDEYTIKGECECCGSLPERRKIDYGDFDRWQADAWVGEYCMSVMNGRTGWGVPFTDWVELMGYAKFDGHWRLIKLPDVQIAEERILTD